MMRSVNRKNQRGIALMLGTCALAFTIPLVGLSVDVGYLYACKSRLQAATDGAALAAARALNLGQTTSSQSDSAKQNAVNWFYANFPTNNWGTTTAATDMSISTVQVFDDPSNPNLRNVVVNSSTRVPTYFMKWFNISSTYIHALGNASRRDVIAMMVLDRSGSMCNGSAPCTTTQSCGPMKTAAKLFTGQFAAGRDRIGLVSFSDNVVVHSAPSTTFQTTLGYSNNSGSATGSIDGITCNGGTGTAAAVNLAYNELYKLALPGALNLILFETDGLPNMVTVNMYDSVNNKWGVSTTSNCTDRNGAKPSSSSFGSTGTKIPYWNGNATTPSYSMGTGGFIADIPAGMVGGFGGSDTGTGVYYLWRTFSSTVSDFINSGDTGVTSSGSPGCLASSGSSVNAPQPDIAWIPTQDVFGDNLTNTGYQTVTTGTVNGITRITSTTGAQIRAAAYNAADQSGYRARSNATLPVMMFGLGFSTSVDHVFMQRMANDPDADPNGNYVSCAAAVNCVTYANQPQGIYMYAQTTADLGGAFLSLSSQILRLSH